MLACVCIYIECVCVCMCVFVYKYEYEHGHGYDSANASYLGTLVFVSKISSTGTWSMIWKSLPSANLRNFTMPPKHDVVLSRPEGCPWISTSPKVSGYGYGYGYGNIFVLYTCICPSINQSPNLLSKHQNTCINTTANQLVVCKHKRS